MDRQSQRRKRSRSKREIALANAMQLARSDHSNIMTLLTSRYPDLYNILD